MAKVLIITSHVEEINNITIDYSDFQAIICADGGFLIAKELGLKADILIGDYDSMEMPDEPNLIKLPMEKDMTDSEAAIDLAISKGYEHITVLGGLGGRLDHTMGNIGILSKYCGKIPHLAFLDGRNYVFMIGPGSISLPKNEYKYLGIISHSDISRGITLEGVKYPLTNFLLRNNTTLGVSNEIIEKRAWISFDAGKLLIILSKD